MSWNELKTFVALCCRNAPAADPACHFVLRGLHPGHEDQWWTGLLGQDVWSFWTSQPQRMSSGLTKSVCLCHRLNLGPCPPATMCNLLPRQRMCVRMYIMRVCFNVYMEESVYVCVYKSSSLQDHNICCSVFTFLYLFCDKIMYLQHYFMTAFYQLFYSLMLAHIFLCQQSNATNYGCVVAAAVYISPCSTSDPAL